MKITGAIAEYSCLRVKKAGEKRVQFFFTKGFSCYR
jgi:hypothetical protein